MTVLIDSSSWLDYFFGNSRGKEIQTIIQSTEEIIISSINLIEIYSKYLKYLPQEAEEKKNFIISRCKFIEPSKEIALEAAKLIVSKKLALADSIIYSTALNNKATLITADNDFKGLEKVKIIQ